MKCSELARLFCCVLDNLEVTKCLSPKHPGPCAGPEHPQEKPQEARQPKKENKPTTFGAAEQRHAEAMQDKLAGAIDKGARSIDGNAPSDVERLGQEGSLQAIEVKTKLKSKNVRMTQAAQARKILRLQEHRQQTGTPAAIHTVALDHRAAFSQGDLSQASTFPAYYKRGGGSFSLSEMHQVNSPEELNHLMSLPDKELPQKARPTERGFWARYHTTKNQKQRSKMLQDALANERKRTRGKQS